MKWKNTAEGAGHRWQYGASALHAGNLRLHKHTLRICNTYCSSTATMFARTRLIVTSQYIICVAVISLSSKSKTGIRVLTFQTLTASCTKLTSHIRRRLYIWQLQDEYRRTAAHQTVSPPVISHVTEFRLYRLPLLLSYLFPDIRT
jgi:hypothetical protein